MDLHQIVGSTQRSHTRNFVTKASMDDMRQPATHEEYEANVQQTIASVLVTLNVHHEHYIHFANELVGTMIKPADWAGFAAEVARMVGMGMGLSRIDARRLLAYREGEYRMLISELRDKLGVTHDAPIAIGPIENPAVVRGALLAVPPDAKNHESLDDEWLSQMTSRCPHLEEVYLPYTRAPFTPKGLALFVGSLPQLRVLHVVGTHGAIDDCVLDQLGIVCTSLEELSFGQDNDRLAPAAVTADVLARCVTRCARLNYLHIANSCQSGDPSNPKGVIAAALTGCGFTLRMVPNADRFKKSNHGAYCFWRPNSAGEFL